MCSCFRVPAVSFSGFSTVRSHPNCRCSTDAPRRFPPQRRSSRDGRAGRVGRTLAPGFIALGHRGGPAGGPTTSPSSRPVAQGGVRQGVLRFGPGQDFCWHRVRFLETSSNPGARTLKCLGNFQEMCAKSSCHGSNAAGRASRCCEPPQQCWDDP